MKRHFRFIVTDVLINTAICVLFVPVNIAIALSACLSAGKQRCSDEANHAEQTVSECDSHRCCSWTPGDLNSQR